MKRTFIAILALVLFAGLVTLPTGCASNQGRYFQTTREHKPHVFRNRIHNPADSRYES